MKRNLNTLMLLLAIGPDSPEEQMQRALAVLSERERVVLKFRFGLNDVANHTQKAVGEMFGVTGQCIRQIEARALGKLRRLALSRLRSAGDGPAHLDSAESLSA